LPLHKANIGNREQGTEEEGKKGRREEGKKGRNKNKCCNKISG
jgi:hypothetical protein